MAELEVEEKGGGHQPPGSHTVRQSRREGQGRICTLTLTLVTRDVPPPEVPSLLTVWLFKMPPASSQGAGSQGVLLAGLLTSPALSLAQPKQLFVQLLILSSYLFVW